MATALGGIEARRAEWLGSRLRLPGVSLQARAAMLFATGLLSIGFLAWFATDEAGSIESARTADLVAGSADSAQLLLGMVKQEAALQGYVLTGDSAYLARYTEGRAQVAAAEQPLQRHLDEAAFRSQVAASEAAAAAWMSWAERERVSVAAHSQGIARGELENGRSLFDGFRAAHSELATSAQKAADGARGAAGRRAHVDSVGMALAAGCGVVTLLFLIYVLLFQVVRPVSQLAATASALAREGDAEVPGTSRRDEVGALAHALLDWRYASAERLAMAKLVAEGEARFRAVFEHAPIGVCRLALSGRILDTNRTLQQMLGHSAEDMARLSIGDLSHPDDRARLQELHDQRVDRFVVERRYLRRDGSVFWGLMTVALARMQDLRPLFYVAMVEDITERKRHEQNLRERATTDALTGLMNRASFIETLEGTLGDRRLRESAVFVLDLDGFKEVNDTLGHAAGDDVLQQVARRLLEAMRTSDVVARLGGDEFAILLPGTGLEGAGVAARKVLSELARPLSAGGARVQVGGSIGIAVAPEHGHTIEALLEQADIAMYRAKRSGGGFEVAA